LPDASYFPLQENTELLEHAAAHFFAQPFDVGGRRLARVDQEIRVLLRYLRRTDSEAAAARTIDQLPCLEVGRIGEGRAAGAAARLGLRARCVDLGDATCD